MPTLLSVLQILQVIFKLNKAAEENENGAFGMKKSKRRKTAKLNNKGVSLVELLVAMVVLSIASVAIYQGIVLSARTNGKAKMKHKATSLAQNVIEGLKAEDINTILHQFTAPETVDGEGNTVVEFDMLPSNILPSTLSGNVGTLDNSPYVNSSVNPEGLTVYESDYVHTADGKYYLYVKGASMENASFDVLVTLDGSPYIEGSASNKGQNYNSETIVQIPSMDSNFDAIMSNCSIYDGEAVSAANSKTDGSYLPSAMSREIIINIDKVNLSGVDTRVADSVKIQYIYRYSGIADPVYSVEEEAFNNSESLEYSLRNLFLFYPPAYGWKEDVIRVNNPKGSEVGIYIIKQKTSDTNLEFKENTYRVSLYVTDQMAATETSLTMISSNLQENLSSGAVATGAKFYFGGSPILTDADKAQKLKLNGLTNSQKKDKMMDVKVEIFAAGEGSFSNADEFRAQAGDKLAEITGSIRN